MTLVAIHQPNFFPWLGYFHKIAAADRFVFLDDCLVQKTGSTWTNRVRLLIAGEPRWVTAPIVRGHGNQLVCDVKFDGQRDWRKKCLASLEIYYRKAPCYKETMDFLLPLVANREPRLADFNVQAVTALAQWMGIDVRKLVRSSTLKIKSSGTQRLIGLVRALNGTAYLCGGGAEGYQEEEMFQDSGLRVEHQCFVHPTYPQFNTPHFVPGLSVIDGLMNLGPNGIVRLFH